MIHNVILRNIKCFASQSFELAGLNILTGINGAGKSTFIQSILLANQTGLDGSIDLNGSLVEIGDYSDIRFDLANDDSVSIKIVTDKGHCEWGYEEGHTFGKTSPFTLLPVLSGSIENFSNVSDSLLYISAERWGPRSSVPVNTHNSNPYWLGKYGEFTISFLNSLSSSTIRDEHGQSIANTRADDPRIHNEAVGNIILSNVIAWMGEITPNVNINASVIREAMIGYSSFSFGGSSSYKASNVGFGLSYVLGIVTALVAARKGSVVILENPEAHLHPRAQSQLGRLMALASLAGVQVIIETHSEHIINGVRIQVRKETVKPEIINIFYVSRDEIKMESQVEQLALNEVGQLDSWPDGFFDQQANDMKTLITGK